MSRRTSVGRQGRPLRPFVCDRLTITAGLRYNFFNALHAIDKQQLRPAAGGCLVARQHGRARWRRDLSYRRAGRPESADFKHGRPLHLHQCSIPRAFLPTDSLPDPRRKRRFGSSHVARLGPPPRKDMYVAPGLPRFSSSSPSVWSEPDVLTTTYTNLVDPGTGVRRPIRHLVLSLGAETWETPPSKACNSLRVGRFKAGFRSRRTTCGPIRSTTAVSAKASRTQDIFCRACDKGSSDDDGRSMFNLAFVYDLPFGAGKRYLSSPGVGRVILGGLWNRAVSEPPKLVCR
jgi:hypothetical protein